MLTPRGLQRRIKQHILRPPHDFFAACAPGFEPELAREIAGLPLVERHTIDSGGVSFSGPIALMYEANLRLRTAHRVLLRIDTFLAQSRPMLFDHARKIRWERYLGFRPAYDLQVSARASRLSHKAGIADTLASAIAERMSAEGLAPQRSERADPRFFVRLYQDRCTVSVDTSGAHLHKRGYRETPGRAPLRETLAAGCALRARIGEYDTVFDPFCGSGTLIIETALLRTNTLPGAQRNFAFEALPFFDGARWERILANLPPPESPDLGLVGRDRDPEAIRIARANAYRAGVEEHCAFETAESLERDPPAPGGRALVFSNLPYGNRIALDADFYGRLGTWLRSRCRGWDVALVTDRPSALIETGVNATRVSDFSNGGLRVALLEGTVPRIG